MLSMQTYAFTIPKWSGFKFNKSKYVFSITQATNGREMYTTFALATCWARTFTPPFGFTAQTITSRDAQGNRDKEESKNEATTALLALIAIGALADSPCCNNTITAN